MRQLPPPRNRTLREHPDGSYSVSVCFIFWHFFAVKYIYSTKFAILSIFKCTVQWHSVFTHCWATTTTVYIQHSVLTPNRNSKWQCFLQPNLRSGIIISVLFLGSESLNPAHTHGEGITGWDYQRTGILGDHPRGWLHRSYVTLSRFLNLCEPWVHPLQNKDNTYLVELRSYSRGIPPNFLLINVGLNAWPWTMKFDHLGLQIMSSCTASWILHDGSITVPSLDPDSRNRKRTEAEAEPWRSRIWSINIHSIIFMQSSASSTEAACSGQSLAHVFSLYCLWELGHPHPPAPVGCSYSPPRFYQHFHYGFFSFFM